MSSIEETNVILFTIIDSKNLRVLLGRREANKYLWNRKLKEHFSSCLVKTIFVCSFLLVDKNRRLTQAYCKGWDSKYFKIREPWRLCCKFFSLYHCNTGAAIDNMQMNEYHSATIWLFTKTDTFWIASQLLFADPYCRETYIYQINSTISAAKGYISLL